MREDVWRSTKESIELLDKIPSNTDNLKELTIMLLKREK